MSIYNEEWRDVEGYEQYYQVSNIGNVRSKSFLVKGKTGLKYHKKSKVLSACTTKDGYKQVCLHVRDIGLRKSFLVHRLVAAAFIPNPENKTQVNHIDFNTSNNNISNLEWCTAIENMTHLFENKPPVRIKGVGNHNNVPVGQFDLKGNLIREYYSLLEAEQYGFCSAHISSVCSGRRKHHKGFIWRKIHY